MVKPITDERIYAKLTEYAHAINIARPTTGHDIGTYMRDGLTGYGECRRVPCRAGFDVRLVDGEPAIMDNSATTDSKCPVTAYWQISSVQGGTAGARVEYAVSEFRTQAEAMRAWEQTGPGHHLSHITGSLHTLIGQK